MLTHLQIGDFAIVDSVEIEFHRGLTVLTGETGAGKSIVVDALQLVGGGRAGAEVVRHGAERAEVSATFDLSEAPRELRALLDDQAIPFEQELSLRRVVAVDGRSRAYLNGQNVPLQIIREAGSLLIDIHGQHEFQSLTRGSAQRELLDDYGKLSPLRDQVGIAHRVWLQLLNHTLELESTARNREGRLELLRYQARELLALELKEGEVAALAEERSRLANHGRLAEAAQTALARLYEGEDVSAHAGVSRALNALRNLTSLDPKLAAVVPMIDEAAIHIREAARELQHYLERLEIDTARQNLVEKRLAAIEELSRKHRVAPSELPQHAAHLEAELASVERADTDLTSVRRNQAAALESYRTLAGQLSAQRATTGRALAKEISARMQTLGMAGGRFQVEITPLQSTEPAPHGIDQVEFRVTANPGQPLRPLAKVASGGELARLSLAVQVSCASRASRCMVFDEVDAGVGGAVAEIVGRELRSLAESGQVLCVTHLPQVASQGHRHLRVAKLSDGRTTRTTVAELPAAERVEEIARMLGGIEVSDRAREHAAEMLRAGSSRAPGEAPAVRAAPARKRR